MGGGGGWWWLVLVHCLLLCTPTLPTTTTTLLTKEEEGRIEQLRVQLECDLFLAHERHRCGTTAAWMASLEGGEDAESVAEAVLVADDVLDHAAGPLKAARLGGLRGPSISRPLTTLGVQNDRSASVC